MIRRGFRVASGEACKPGGGQSSGEYHAYGYLLRPRGVSREHVSFGTSRPGIEYPVDLANEMVRHLNRKLDVSAGAYALAAVALTYWCSDESMHDLSPESPGRLERVGMLAVADSVQPTAAMDRAWFQTPRGDPDMGFVNTGVGNAQKRRVVIYPPLTKAETYHDITHLATLQSPPYGLLPLYVAMYAGLDDLLQPVVRPEDLVGGRASG